jgi:hypothetical protein
MPRLLPGGVLPSAELIQDARVLGIRMIDASFRFLSLL